MHFLCWCVHVLKLVDDTCLQELLKPSAKSYVVHFLGMEQVPKSDGVDTVRGPIRVRSVYNQRMLAVLLLEFL